MEIRYEVGGYQKGRDRARALPSPFGKDRKHHFFKGLGVELDVLEMRGVREIGAFEVLAQTPYVWRNQDQATDI
jgi:hypothetical protein